MSREISQHLQRDVGTMVESALGRDGTVNVPVLAEMIRQRHLAENVALEDIEQLVLARAQMLGAPMAFAPRNALDWPGPAEHGGHGLS